MRTYINGHSIGSVIDIQDEKKVKAIKRAIETVFLANNLIEYEPQVDATIEKLMESLKRRGHATSFNLYEMVQHFQLDFLLLIAFGEDAGCLRQGKDVLGLTGLTHRRLQHWYSWQPVPSLERFIFQNPLWSGRFVQKSRWAREGASRVEARRRLLASHELPPSSKPTTEASRATDLIDKYFQASHKYPDAIPPKLLSNLVNSTIAAGTDTTIGSITIILYFLLKHPSVLAKLLAELNQADISFSSSFPIPYSAVKSLPYLDAVIKESLRLLAVLGTILERTVPPQGSTLIGPGMAHHLPGGTVVGCSPYVVHRHEPTFGPDADRFVPERWTTWASSTSTSSSPAQKLAMDQANLSWSHGARTCLGKNLALIEMKKLIPTLLLKVEFQLCDPSLDLKIERGILDSDEFPIMVTARLKE